MAITSLFSWLTNRGNRNDQRQQQQQLTQNIQRLPQLTHAGGGRTLGQIGLSEGDLSAAAGHGDMVRTLLNESRGNRGSYQNTPRPSLQSGGFHFPGAAAQGGAVAQQGRVTGGDNPAYDKRAGSDTQTTSMPGAQAGTTLPRPASPFANPDFTTGISRLLNGQAQAPADLNLQSFTPGAGVAGANNPAALPPYSPQMLNANAQGPTGQFAGNVAAENAPALPAASIRDVSTDVNRMLQFLQQGAGSMSGGGGGGATYAAPQSTRETDMIRSNADRLGKMQLSPGMGAGENLLAQVGQYQARQLLNPTDSVASQELIDSDFEATRQQLAQGPRSGATSQAIADTYGKQILDRNLIRQQARAQAAQGATDTARGLGELSVAGNNATRGNLQASNEGLLGLTGQQAQERAAANAASAAAQASADQRAIAERRMMIDLLGMGMEGERYNQQADLASRGLSLNERELDQNFDLRSRQQLIDQLMQDEKLSFGEAESLRENMLRRELANQGAGLQGRELDIRNRQGDQQFEAATAGQRMDYDLGRDTLRQRDLESLRGQLLGERGQNLDYRTANRGLDQSGISGALQAILQGSGIENSRYMGELGAGLEMQGLNDRYQTANRGMDIQELLGLVGADQQNRGMTLQQLMADQGHSINALTGANNGLANQQHFTQNNMDRNARYWTDIQDSLNTLAMLMA